MGLFGKKKEVVDLRPKDADMPIPARMREKLLPAKSGASIISSASSTASPTETSSNSGGFFGFFGGGDSSSSAASTNSSSAVSAPAVEETKTDFWGNPVSTASNSSVSINNQNDNSVGEMSYKLSRMTDRLELVEKKLGRMERKLGITSGSD